MLPLHAYVYQQVANLGIASGNATLIFNGSFRIKWYRHPCSSHFNIHQHINIDYYINFSTRTFQDAYISVHIHVLIVIAYWYSELLWFKHGNSNDFPYIAASQMFPKVLKFSPQGTIKCTLNPLRSLIGAYVFFTSAVRIH